MSKGFLSAVGRAFMAELPPTLPGFQLSPSKEQMHGVLFESRLSEEMWLFVYVSIAQHDDAFTLEIAWNDVGRFPFNTMPFPIVDDAGAYQTDVLKKSTFRSRIANLMGLRRSVWWQGAETASLYSMMNELRGLAAGRKPEKPLGRAIGANAWPGLQISVRDACDKLARLALPLFDALAKSHGIRK